MTADMKFDPSEDMTRIIKAFVETRENQKKIINELETKLKIEKEKLENLPKLTEVLYG